MTNMTRPCKWATGKLDAVLLEWSDGPRLIAYRRCCQAQEKNDPGPCIFCMENWTRADRTAADAISRACINCHGPYQAVKVASNRITPEPEIS